MTTPKIDAQQRALVVQAGMTPTDVMNAKNATEAQKKMACVFDADGIEGYSQREADIFNATKISDKGKNGISLNTRFYDYYEFENNYESVKETKLNGNIESVKYAPEGEPKPYTNQKAEFEDVYDKKGRVMKEYKWGDNPDLPRYYNLNKYNSHGDLVEQKSYTLNGENWGSEKYEYEYNLLGMKTKCTSKNSSSDSTVEEFYNLRGKKTKEVYRKEDGHVSTVLEYIDNTEKRTHYNNDGSVESVDIMTINSDGSVLINLFE